LPALVVVALVRARHGVGAERVSVGDGAPAWSGLAGSEELLAVIVAE
jgi:hypothetical protein